MFDEQAVDSDDYDVWDAVLSGERPPIDIIYVAEEDVDLADLEEWGQMAGMWTIRRVESAEQAIRENEKSPADMMILLGTSVADAERIARAFPAVPLSVARHGGWEEFPQGWPAQVVLAQWSSPREGEFQDAIANVLRKVTTEIVYSTSECTIEAFSVVSEELLERLSKYPEERFELDPRIFEETVAELLCRMGYDVRLTPRTGDLGRDVLASFGTPVAPLLMLVECKRYRRGRLVGPEPVARVWYRLFDDHANMAMVVTTSGFQPVARQMARDRGYQLALKEGTDFIEWIRSLRATH